jgi:hypothetical protein
VLDWSPISPFHPTGSRRDYLTRSLPHEKIAGLPTGCRMLKTPLFFSARLIDSAKIATASRCRRRLWSDIGSDYHGSPSPKMTAFATHTTECSQFTIGLVTPAHDWNSRRVE